MWVTDFPNSRVVKLAASSSSQEVLPFIGLYQPMGVAVDAAGNLYVTEYDIDRVLKLPAG